MSGTNRHIKNKFNELYDELFLHDGYGRIEVEMKILRRSQKEIIIRCGKEYRFVVDFQAKDKCTKIEQVKSPAIRDPAAA